MHDVGAWDGQHYFTMDYIEGISLDQKLAEGPLPGKAAARYVRILARAVNYAHRQGILHRDLKPSNVLIDLEDEPHITDFGLAKRLGNDKAGSGQTRSGAILGTPSYMSPEQAQGKTAQLGPAADVYSLGAILYELLTGRPPFRAETPLDTVMQVIDTQPVPPRLLNPKIDHDLETICLKCLEKNIDMRYGSAEALGEDLQRYLNGDSIQARSFNVLDRLAHVLERDAHTADFSTWSSMVLLMAVAVGLEHCAVFVLVWAEMPHGLVTAARGVLFVFLGGLFFYNRGSRLLPTSAAERELWTIWIGYFATYFCHRHRDAPVDVLRDLSAQSRLAGPCLFSGVATVPVHLRDVRAGVLHHGRQLLGPLLRVRPGVLPRRGPDAVADDAGAIDFRRALGDHAGDAGPAPARSGGHGLEAGELPSPSQAPTVQYKGPK